MRKRLAEESGLPPYVIFHDSTLRQMAAELPIARQHLLRIQGVGERKASQYGDLFLDSIAAYIRETGARPIAITPTPPPRRQKGGLSLTVQTTLDSFRAGKTIAEIAAARQLTTNTIEGHLAGAIEAGERVDIQRLVSEKKRQAIEAALSELGPEPLRPVMDRLGDGYTYGEIRIVLAWLQAGKRET
ncbi:MAG: helix-turn-helix domain-containing protein [Chloroflexi bacterium]|nr:helix-turn-helix domain-containing protein [Chloroflexota bacterium]